MALECNGQPLVKKLGLANFRLVFKTSGDDAGGLTLSAQVRLVKRPAPEMRLTCPNCGARYEVAESAIPPEGRDVQCSNCATTWFQPGARSEGATSEPIPAPAPPPAAPPPPPEAPELEPDAASAPTQTPPQFSRSAAEEGAADPRRELDPEVAGILREEAAREAQLRQAELEPSAVETQPEMPLDGGRRPLPAEMEEAREVYDVVDGVEAPGASRGELLPDIDEINSTLRSAEDRAAQTVSDETREKEDRQRRRRRNVRRGFFLVLFLALLAALLYVFHPEVIARFPQFEGQIMQFVDWVDGLRLWLDGMARSLGERSGTDG